MARSCAKSRPMFALHLPRIDDVSNDWTTPTCCEGSQRRKRSCKNITDGNADLHGVFLVHVALFIVVESKVVVVFAV